MLIGMESPLMMTGLKRKATGSFPKKRWIYCRVSPKTSRVADFFAVPTCSCAIGFKSSFVRPKKRKKSSLMAFRHRLPESIKAVVAAFLMVIGRNLQY